MSLAATAEVDKHELRRVMGHYATGVSIVTAVSDGVPHGLAVNSLTSVSLEPPLVLFCPSKASETWPAISEAGLFVINILAAGQGELCRRFARKGLDRFGDIAYRTSPNGVPVLADVVGYLECRIEQVHDAGDHYVAIGRVLEMGATSDLPPLVFYRGTFHGLSALQG
jgi:3-hydroxy-9,10-secoandrosta-1,3,5(10)-triene-9,17-dione monooxygenase reductase component